MTTSVVVEAHCNERTQVRIRRSDGQPDTVIHDGQRREFFVHDDVTVAVREEPKYPEFDDERTQVDG